MPVQRHLSILAIIAVTAIVFAVEAARSLDFAEKYGAVPTVIASAYQEIAAGRFSLSAAQALSRLVTSVFLHGGAQHILFNMVFLWVFGILLSQHLGQWWTLVIYLICGVCGNLLQVGLSLESPIPIIGASGAISGLAGVYLGLAMRWELPWPDIWPLAHPIPPMQLGAFALIGFATDMYFLNDGDQHIAYGAHVGGFLSGLAIAAVITTLYPTSHAYWRTARKF